MRKPVGMEGDRSGSLTRPHDWEEGGSSCCSDEHSCVGRRKASGANAADPPLVFTIRVSLPIKNVVSMGLYSQPGMLICFNNLGMFGFSMKPYRAMIRTNPRPTSSIVVRSLFPTRGIRTVLIWMSSTQLWTILLCLILWSRVWGIKSSSPPK